MWLNRLNALYDLQYVLLHREKALADITNQGSEVMDTNEGQSLSGPHQ